MSKKKSLGKNAIYSGTISVLNLIFPLITFPYVSHVLSVDGVGINNFSGTYVGYFALISALGISTYAVREGTKYRDNREKITSFANEIFSINMFFTVIAYVLLVASLLIFKNLQNYVNCILIYSLQIIFSTLGTDWIYTIFEDYGYITLRNISFKIISIVLLFILVRNKYDYLWYAAVTVFATVGSNIFNFFHTRIYVSLKLIKKINWKRHLKPILIIFASSVAVNIYVYSDTTLLGLMKNEYSVGIYGTATKFYQLAQGLITSLLTVTIPRLAMLFGKKKLGEYKKLLNRVINILTILVLPACVGLIMVGKEVVIIVAGEKYIEATMPVQILAWAIIFSIFSWLFSDCVLIPAKREKYILRGTIITAIVNVIFNLLFIPLLSFNATALSTVLSEILVMLMNGYYSWDIIHDIVINKDNIMNILSSIIGCLGIILICTLINLGVDSLIGKLILSVILSVFIYCAILVFLKNRIIMEFMITAKNKVLKR